MSVEILDGNTIVDFVNSEEVFTVSVHELFLNLDSDNDGQLSYAEMLKELQGLRMFETHFGIDEAMDPGELASAYKSVFIKFDHDSNGQVDFEEFKDETRQMLLAMGNGMGFLPVQMALEEGSLLKKAVDWESAKNGA